MLGLFRRKAEKKKTEDEINETRQRALDEAIQQAARLKKLSLAENTGWKDFVLLIDDYVKKIQQRKLATALDRVNDETIYQLKLLDHEIFILNWVVNLPNQFVDNLEAELKRQRESADGE